MAPRWALLGLLVGLGAAAPCRAAAVRWYDTYEEGLEAARKTGRPMAIVFGLENDKLRAAKKLFERDQLVPFHRLFVFIYVEVSVKDGMVSHGLFHKYSPGEGRITFPLTFFADGEEKVLSKLQGGQSAGDLTTEMAAVLKKHGGIASPKKLREAQEKLDDANALLERKQYGAAARLYKDVVDLNLRVPATETAKKELAKIQEMAKKQLESARADVADRAYPNAVSKLLDLEETFSPLPEAREAHEELARLRALPEVKEALEKAETREAAAAPAAPGHTDDPNDVAGDFFTEEELDALDRMADAGEAKPGADEAAAATECRRLLTLARSWIANKRPEKARELLEKVVADHPGTIYADQAKALLEKLP